MAPKASREPMNLPCKISALAEKQKPNHVRQIIAAAIRRIARSAIFGESRMPRR